MVCLAFLVNSVVTAIAMRIVVARAKKCWDFGATVYLFHLLAVTLFDGFPLRWFWWALMAGCATITILFSELLCVRYEMADIPLTGVLSGCWSAAPPTQHHGHDVCYDKDAAVSPARLARGLTCAFRGKNKGERWEKKGHWRH